MPYRWTTPAPNQEELTLWPHNALSRAGLAAMVLGFFGFASIPLVFSIGTIVFWFVLPFMLLATWALDFALKRNIADRQIVEQLTITQDRIRLTRTDPKGAVQDWQANPYWTKATLHKDEGPVPNYVTLKGQEREVEIGAFLGEDERKHLYDDLVQCLRRINQPQG